MGKYENFSYVILEVIMDEKNHKSSLHLVQFKADQLFVTMESRGFFEQSLTVEYP